MPNCLKINFRMDDLQIIIKYDSMIDVILYPNSYEIDKKNYKSDMENIFLPFYY